MVQGRMNLFVTAKTASLLKKAPTWGGVKIIRDRLYSGAAKACAVAKIGRIRNGTNLSDGQVILNPANIYFCQTDGYPEISFSSGEVTSFLRPQYGRHFWVESNWTEEAPCEVPAADSADFSCSE